MEPPHIIHLQRGDPTWDTYLDTRDDGGTRPNVNQVGLVWWDDVQVNEITATPAELKARGSEEALVEEK